MSVFVNSGMPGETKLIDGVVGNYAYKIEASGSLTILVANGDLKWSVLLERSATSFVDVSGTRYLPDTAKLAGSGGKAQFVKKPASPTVVL